MSNPKRRYVHISATNAVFETRLMKQARTALNSGLFDDVLVLAKKGRGDEDLALREIVEASITVERLEVSRIAPGLNVLIWFARVASACLKSKPAVISIHHVFLLPLGVVLKLLCRAQLVYDAHELETESASLSKRPLLKPVSKLIEGTLIHACDQTIVVNDAIADWYNERYPKARIASIYNYPRRSLNGSLAPSKTLREIHNIPKDKTVFIYQGAFSWGRGLPVLLDAFASGLIPNGVLVLMGFGEYENKVREAAAASPHVRFQPAVPQGEIVAYAATADVGVHIAEPICLSYALSLPNKLFEYIQAGLPVVVSAELPLMAQFVTDNGLGIATPPDRESIAATLRGLTETDVSAFKSAVAAAAPYLTWESQEPRLIELYGRLATASSLAGHPEG